MSVDEEDNVISFPEGVEARAALAERAEARLTRQSLRPFCRHASTVIDDRARVVECKSCKAVLDPFDLLSRLASQEEHWRYRAAEVREFAGRVEELKKEIQRLKAQKRRLEKKA